MKREEAWGEEEGSEDIARSGRGESFPLYKHQAGRQLADGMGGIERARELSVPPPPPSLPSYVRRRVHSTPDS